MDTLPRVLAAAILLTLLPLAVTARSAAQTPPQEPPETGQAKEDESSDDIRKEVEQAVDAIRAYSAERRADAVADARRAADELDRQLQRLQEQTDRRWDRMSEAARARSQATMADLRNRRNTLAEWAGGMRHSSSAAWAEVRTGFVESYHELADALRKARAEYDQASNENADQDKAAKPESDGKR